MAEEEEDEAKYDTYEYDEDEVISFSTGSHTEVDYEGSGQLVSSESITSLQFMLSSIQQERTRDVCHKFVTEPEGERLRVRLTH